MDTQDIVVLRYVKNYLPIIKHGNMIYPDLRSDERVIALFTEEGRLRRSCDNVGCVGKGLLRGGVMSLTLLHLPRQQVK